MIGVLRLNFIIYYMRCFSSPSCTIVRPVESYRSKGESLGHSVAEEAVLHRRSWLHGKAHKDLHESYFDQSTRPAEHVTMLGLRFGSAAPTGRKATPMAIHG